MKKIIISFILILNSIVFAQENAARILLDEIKEKIEKVNDYKAHLEISVNMDFLRMPKTKAELLFKRPDKIKFNSDGFALLPKSGFDFNPQKIIDSDFDAKIISDTSFSNPNLVLIDIIPKSDTSKFESAHLIIDEQNKVITEINLSPIEGAGIKTLLTYEDQIEYALPSQIDVTFDVIEPPEDSKKNKRRSRVPKTFSGSINIKYSDYQINQGIDDSIFKNDDKDESEE